MKNYVTFGEEGSDVHVFQLGGVRYCGRCKLVNDDIDEYMKPKAYETFSIEEMREHLRKHVQVGHKVGPVLVRITEEIDGPSVIPEPAATDYAASPQAKILALENIINFQLPELRLRLVKLELVLPAVQQAVAVIHEQLAKGPTPQRLNKDVLKEVLAILEGG